MGLKVSDPGLGLKYSEQAVQAITGLPIDKAILIDFSNFLRLIDSLGGIKIKVTKAFDDYYYPVAGRELDSCGRTPEDIAALSATMSGFLLEKQFPCRYEHLHFDVGEKQIDGITALKYARSRHSAQDGTDYARGLRQQGILLGIKDRLLSLDVLDNLDDFFESFVKMVNTDLDLDTTKSVASLIVNPEDYRINQIVLSEENVLTSLKNSLGQYVLIPKAGENNWLEVQKYIREQINED